MPRTVETVLCTAVLWGSILLMLRLSRFVCSVFPRRVGQVGKVTLHTKCASSKGGLHRYHPLVFRQPHLCVLDMTLHMVRVVSLLLCVCAPTPAAYPHGMQEKVVGWMGIPGPRKCIGIVMCPKRV